MIISLVQSARAHLLQLGKRLRAMDKEAGCNHCAIADLLFLYAHTVNWFQAIRDYKANSGFRLTMFQMPVFCMCYCFQITKHL